MVQPGAMREFVVMQNDTRTKQLAISSRKIEESTMWERMHQISREGATVKCKLEGNARAGALVSVWGFSGFIPMSKLGTLVRPSC